MMLLRFRTYEELKKDKLNYARSFMYNTVIQIHFQGNDLWNLIRIICMSCRILRRSFVTARDGQSV